MAKLPDGVILERVDYVVLNGDRVVWPEQADFAHTTKEQAEEAALRIGGVVMPCQVFKMPVGADKQTLA